MRKNFRLLFFVGFIALAVMSAFAIRFQPAAAQEETDQKQIAAPQATFVVNSTADPGTGVCDAAECTLREAINAANGNGGFDEISFNIAGAGPFTIQPVTELPAVTEGVLINGYTQSGSVTNSSCTGTATLQIVLNGALAPAGSNGLTVMTGASTVRGLVINGFDGNGIEIMSGGNSVRGNFIGTNAAGTASVPNNTNGVQITGGASNEIGSGIVQGRNVISGNAGRGIVVSGLGGANSTFILSNYIGTSADGNSDVGNGGDGVDISQSANNRVGGITTTLGCVPGNVISGNNEDGIGISGTSATGNIVQGNLIGTNAAGTADLGNSSSGINIFASGNAVGGATVETRNIISGNDGGGVVIGGGMNNAVQGNYIGTNLAGTAALRNPDGVRIDGGANNNTIGIGGMTPLSGQANLISGNDVGVHIADGSGNLVRGNLIGTGADGTSDVGNLEAGVYIHEPTSFGNAVGGAGDGDGNTIRFNGDGTLNPALQGEGGVVIYFGATNNPILRNSITENTGLGIDLDSFATPAIGADGVTPNDALDADSGDANNLQNYPVLASANNNTVTGTLNSTPSRTFRVEFFSDTAADPSGNGEGRTFIGAQNVTTNPAGTALFTFTTTTPVQTGNVVTATATDSTTGDTSEFSATVTAAGGSGSGGQGFEADVAPRPNGSNNGTVSISDVQQLLRFQSGADTDYQSNEFQRADCAPFSSRGNGSVSISDVQQALRYQSGADAVQPAAGPQMPGGPPPSALTNDAPPLSKSINAPQQSVVSAVGGSASAGQTVTVRIVVDAEGTEKGFGFSLNYNLQLLTFVSATLGEDVPSNSFLEVNPRTDPTNPNNGEIGIGILLQSSAPPVTAGMNRRILIVQFTVNAGATAQTTPITFDDTPAIREVTNAQAQTLPSMFEDGTVTILGPTAANVTLGGRVIDGKGRGVSKAQLTMTGSKGEQFRAVSNSFGYFKFTEVPAGESYVITVRSKRYRFAAQSVNAGQDLNDIVFIAEPE